VTTKGGQQKSAHAREEAKQETREALLRAGLELFAEQGLDVPSLDALCARAGYTRGAFYVHFADREAFIVAVMEAATSRFVDAVLSGRGSSSTLAETVASFAASVEGGAFPVFGDVPVHQFLTACARSDALRERYAALMLAVRARLTEATRDDQRRGAVRSDLAPELVAGLLLAVALGVGTMSSLGVPFDAAAHAEALLGLLGGAGTKSSRRPPRPPPRG
jgi:AcrR family transcriptional regulator